MAVMTWSAQTKKIVDDRAYFSRVHHDVPVLDELLELGSGT